MCRKTLLFGCIAVREGAAFHYLQRGEACVFLSAVCGGLYREQAELPVSARGLRFGRRVPAVSRRAGICGVGIQGRVNARLFCQSQWEDTVVIIRIVTKGTMDGEVLKALTEKEKVQDRLIEAVRVELDRKKEAAS